MRPRNRQMAGAGPDERYANEGVGQRSRPTGMLSNTDENPSMGLQKRQGDNGLYGTDAVGKPLGPAVTVGGGNATTVPSALSAPELRGRPERVFRPSTHYYVDGLDTGPSLQPANRVGQLFARGLPWQTSGG